MARSDGNTESVAGSSSSDLRSESYAFLARRAWEIRAQESVPVSVRSRELRSRSYSFMSVEAFYYNENLTCLVQFILLTFDLLLKLL